jgi:peroxiredoxin Q/BCP
LGVKVLGASFDTVAANRAFAEKYQFNFPLICDTDRAVGLAYHACDDASAGAARRISYLIGADGKIEAAYEKVSARSHPGDVLAALAL